MKTRLATFNVENLFDRPVVMNYENNNDGQPVLDDYHVLNELLKERTYTPQIKKDIESLIDKYKLLDRTIEHKELILREIRGKLWTQHQDGSRTWVAKGGEDFLGWVDLEREPINDLAIKNTARVLAEVSADIQILIEIEDRLALEQFHDSYLVPELKKLGKKPYKHLLSFQGNDERRINIALMSRFPVMNMKSHIELLNTAKRPMFPRDCAQYNIKLSETEELIILANHFSSQGSDKTGKRRKEQSLTVAGLVDTALGTTKNIAVMGDLNESYITNVNLYPLTNHPSLKDVMELDKYTQKGGLPGTYLTASKSQKLDYILLSTDLQSKVTDVDVERRGFKSTKWPSFSAVTGTRDQASDHHCVWVDIEMGL